MRYARQLELHPRWCPKISRESRLASRRAPHSLADIVRGTHHDRKVSSRDRAAIYYQGMINNVYLLYAKSRLLSPELILQRRVLIISETVRDYTPLYDQLANLSMPGDLFAVSQASHALVFRLE